VASNPLARYRAPATPAPEPEPEPTSNPLAAYRPKEEEEAEPSFGDTLKTRLKGAAKQIAQGGVMNPVSYLRAVAEAAGGEGGGDAAERGLLKSAPVVGPLIEEISGAVKAVPAALAASGRPAYLSGMPVKPESLPQVKKDYVEGRNEEQARTDKAAEKPYIFGGTQVLGSLASPAAGASNLAKLGFGLGETVISSVADSRADLTEGEFTEAAKDLGVGLGLGAAAHGAGAAIRGVKGASKTAAEMKAARITPDDLNPVKTRGTVGETNLPPFVADPNLTPKQNLDRWAREVKEAKETARVLPSRAETNYRHQTLDAIGNGATQVEKTRAWPNDTARNNALELVESDKALKAAVVSKDQEKIAEAADRIADEATRKTQPAYDAMDKDGLFQIEELKTAVRKEIKDIRTPGRRNEEARVGTLEKLLADVDDYAKPHGGQALPHRKLRELATSFLKEKNQVVGSQAETPNYVFRRDNHELVDRVLNERIDRWAAAKPESTKLVEDLRKANRQISSALGISTTAQNALDRVERTAKTPARQNVQAVRDLQKDFDGGVAVGLARKASKAVGLSEANVEKFSEDQVRKFGELAIAIRKGDAIKVEAAKKAALSVGVPQRAVRALLVAHGATADVPGEEQRQSEAPRPLVARDSSPRTH
jgi:hypothetical protein